MLEWRTLVSEDCKTLSLGRIAFWIALGYSTWFWFHPYGAAFPPALLEFLYATLAYNLGRAGVSAYQRVKTTGFLASAGQLGQSGIGSIVNQIVQPHINTPVCPPTQSQPTAPVSTDDVTDEDIAQTRR